VSFVTPEAPLADGSSPTSSDAAVDDGPSEVVEESSSPTRTEWIAAETPPAATLLEGAGYSRDLALLLARRGAETPAQASAFLHPSQDQLHDPRLLAGMSKAVERLIEARDRGEKVAIVGDYDVDGVSGTALLMAAFGACGIAAVAIVPHRMRDGYGFQASQVARAADLGCRLIVTVDCGTTSTTAIRGAGESGVEVIVLDHHLPADDFPANTLQINPRQESCDYPFVDLAAVGLALKLAIALLEGVGKPVPLAALLRVACLGTIADLVPLTGENRVIAALGLRALGSSKSPGLQALMAVSRVKLPVRAEDVGFRLGPRINAAGRLDSAERALDLLLTRESEDAERLAMELDRWNLQRRGEEQRVVDEAFEIFDAMEALPKLLVAWSPNWHRGVVGIAAGRLARRYHRPAILLAVEGDTATGSGRSIEGIHLHGFVRRWRDDLERFGGHAQAIGLTVRSERLESLRGHWIDSADWPAEALTRRYRYELELENARAFDPAFYQRLQQLEPFGMANPAPTLRVGPLRLLAEPRCFGVDHLQALAEDRSGGRIRLLGWRWQKRLDDLRGWFEVLGHAEWDDYVGAPILRLIDARPTAAGETESPEPRV
jgi:single-stranded-DNA-specific exonuclease